MSTTPAPQDLQAILKVNGYTPKELKCLNLVDIIPDSINGILDNGLWDSCPFSFGDSNYTLIDAITIRNWIQDFVDADELPKKKQKDFVKFVELLNLCFDANVYINVE